jgi:hypothetical protein
VVTVFVPRALMIKSSVLCSHGLIDVFIKFSEYTLFIFSVMDIGQFVVVVKKLPVFSELGTEI